MKRFPAALRGIAAAITLALGACLYTRSSVHPVPLPPGPQVIESAVRVHLLDGGAAVFPGGLQIVDDTLVGLATRYSLDRQRSWPVGRIPLDSVAGMESFSTEVRPTESALLSVGAVALAVTAAAAAAVAIFGSCPTIYADSAGTAVMEAEAFSYSIAPLFEARDVDRLRIVQGEDGFVQLEIRNEAAETHFINKLGLVSVTHPRSAFVVPDQDGRAISLNGLAPLAGATDRSGRDLRAALASLDGELAVTSAAVLRAATEGDFDDHIDLIVPVPPGADSVALHMHMRGSLLTTVLLYDVLLAAQGARAVDWVGGELTQIASAVELARWYGGRMGMRILVEENGEYRQAAYLPSSGPIAWRSAAVVLPATASEKMRVRLSFTADEWRIDRIAVATGFARPAERLVPVSEVVTPDGESNAVALAHLRDSDDRFAEILPGASFRIRFEVGPPPQDSSRTFMIASQGYYLEWIRPAWVRQAAGSPRSRFSPSDSSLVQALRLWADKRETFEESFMTSRVPTR